MRCWRHWLLTLRWYTLIRRHHDALPSRVDGFSDGSLPWSQHPIIRITALNCVALKFETISLAPLAFIAYLNTFFLNTSCGWIWQPTNSRSSERNLWRGHRLPSRTVRVCQRDRRAKQTKKKKFVAKALFLFTDVPSQEGSACAADLPPRHINQRWQPSPFITSLRLLCDERNVILD